jgi:hypothetical protein
MGAIERFSEQHRHERPLLLNPYFDDPAEYFAWQADEVLQEVSLVPRADNPDAEAFCAAAIRYYGLNRKVMRDARYFYYYLYLAYRMTLAETAISPELRTQIQNRIERMKSASAPFAGMIRYFDGQADPDPVDA